MALQEHREGRGSHSQGWAAHGQSFVRGECEALQVKDTEGH
jgi:hypothetical protein